MNEEQLETLGELVDKADNYLALDENHFMLLQMRHDGVMHGLKDLRAGLVSLYKELGGEEFQD